MPPADDATTMDRIRAGRNARMPDGYYRLEGHTPVRCADFLTWATWMETTNRHVAEHRGDGWWLSTVFLGRALAPEDDPPLLFETALFADDRMTDILDRYATWEQARHGHWVYLGKVPYVLAPRDEEEPTSA